MLFRPSEDEHAAAADVCCSVPRFDGVSSVPETFAHADNEA